LDVHPIHDTDAANVNGFLGITKKFIGKWRESDEGNGEKDAKLRENGGMAENLPQFMDALYKLVEARKLRRVFVFGTNKTDLPGAPVKARFEESQPGKCERKP
jgi:hypothetical protein